MSSAVTDWDNEYARWARVASQQRTQGLSSSSSDAQALYNALSRLNSQLSSLPLSSEELARRRNLIAHLQQQSNSNSALSQQDEMLDDLAMGMSRLKVQSQMIGEEAKLHLNLLNDMEQQADHAQSGLWEETQRAQQLRERQSVWKLQCIIVALAILFVLLVLKGLGV